MKAPVDRATTRRVLADIRDAVRPVERARTAAAVDRVLATASPGVYENSWGQLTITMPLAQELGFEFVPRWSCPRSCEVCDAEDDGVDNLPYLTYHLTRSTIPEREVERYLPHVVSPHLFGDPS